MNNKLRWILAAGLALVVVLAMAVGAFFAFAGRYDFASLAAERLTASLQRKVTIRSLHVTPGRWLHVELRDFQLANLPSGSRPIMMTVPNASAELDAMALLQGAIVMRGLTVDGLQLFLEHTSDDKKNWHFGDVDPNAPPKPTDRTKLPILFDARIAGDVVVRTSSGHALDTHLDQFVLHTAGTDTPVRLDGTGSYNGTPIKLEADLGSLDTLRETAIPYPADIVVTSGDTTLHFKGTMTKPLDVDGAKGTLELTAPTSKAILGVAGVSGDFNASLRLAGPVEHDEPLWHLIQARGSLNADTITSVDLKLIEGPHGKPDNVIVDLAFEHLDANALLAAKKKAPSTETDMRLDVVRAPDTLVAAKVTALELAYNGIQASEVTFGGSLKPGQLTVDVFSLGYIGASFRASGKIAAEPGSDDGRVTANVDMDRMDVQALRKLLGAGELPLYGRMDGGILVDATGATLNQAAHEARLSAVFAMNGGSVARQIIELASTDARTIFRKATGTSALSCLVGVLDIRQGIGTISPLRIRSVGGTITGRGSFDIYRRQLDITVASEARTTSLFALDVPVRITGSFASPTIRPATLSAAGRAQLSAGDNVSRLLPALQPFARRSTCLSARAD